MNKQAIHRMHSAATSFRRSMAAGKNRGWARAWLSGPAVICVAAQFKEVSKLMKKAMLVLLVVVRCGCDGDGRKYLGRSARLLMSSAPTSATAVAA